MTTIIEFDARNGSDDNADAISSLLAHFDAQGQKLTSSMYLIHLDHLEVFDWLIDEGFIPGEFQLWTPKLV